MTCTKEVVFTVAQGDRERLDAVTGAMHFAPRSPEEERPKHDVTIRNARPIVNELSLDREGFCLIQHPNPCANERNPEVLCQTYAREMIPFIQDYFGTSRVVPKLDAVIFRRAGVPVLDGAHGTPVSGVREPSTSAHIDYMPIAGPMLAAMANQGLGIPITSYSRLVIVNTWRAISAPPQDFPLAVCDDTSIPEADIVSHDFTDHATGVSWAAGLPRYNPRHRWYYFPHMTEDELLLFKGYDSERFFKVAHGAFDNRLAFADAKPRESIEARFYVYFD